MEPLLSVIVPVYKVEAYLRDCVDSILAQTYQNLEIILVDDGSPDNCGAICDEYAAKDSRIRVIHKPNGGPSDARNIGIELAKGEYLTFVDSDDWIDSTLYQQAMAYAPFPILLFGCTDVYANAPEKKIVNVPSFTSVLSWKENAKQIETLFTQSIFGYTCTKIYHQDVLKHTRFDDLRYREDLLFNLKVFSNFSEFQTLDFPGYYYNHHENSLLTGSYSGEVPDIASIAEQMTFIHPDLSPSANRKIANFLVKPYLVDAIQKFIFLNKQLDEPAKLQALKALLQSKSIRRTLRFYRGDCVLFHLVTFSYKFRCSSLFYRILKRKWSL